jgi:hypothetical protein
VNGYLLETNVPSEFSRDRPERRVVLSLTAHDLTVVTRNVKDFAGLGVTVFNPWDAA